MAALVEPAPSVSLPDVHDLRSLRSGDLEPLLVEETREWLDLLHWDFEKSADLVRKFVDMRALSGAALVSKAGVLGYAYYVLEDQKGLLGDVYVRREFRTAEFEQRLLNYLLNEMMATSFVTRIESQLMMLAAPLEQPSTGARYFHLYPRDYLSLARTARRALAPGKISSRVAIEPWIEPHQELAAQLIADSYQGHVDSLINDQYRSAVGARKFLYNIVQYPGCGTFFKSASLSAFERGNRLLCGICLASIVGPEAGHITQICVLPKWQGESLGYELLRRSIELLWETGCQTISLTVTSQNRNAAILYRRLGFEPIRHFAAYVWEGW